MVVSLGHDGSAVPRQVLDSGQLLLIASTGMLVIAALAHTAAEGLVQPRLAVSFGVLIAVGELVRMTMPGGRETAPIGTAAALGYTLLLNVGPEPAVHSSLQVIAVTAGSMGVGLLPHLAVGRPPRLDAVARRVLAVAVVALVFRPLAAHLSPIRDHWWVALAVMTALVVFSWLIDVLVAAAIRTEKPRTRFAVALRDELRVLAPLGAAVSASGMLIALASHVMGLTALLVFTAPLLVTQVAFRRYAGIRSTYLQTVRALARVTEVGGYVENGHSRRVSWLAVAVGRELGMREAALLELEYAALMHDIGQLSLRDPIPGGATVLAAPAEQRRIARLGAEVIRQTGVLDSVADIVSRQCDPYLGSPDTSSPPISSRIIRAANAFDDLVGSSLDPDRAAAALERLRLDTAREYDPQVVEALARVVAGREAFARR